VAGGTACRRPFLLRLSFHFSQSAILFVILAILLCQTALAADIVLVKGGSSAPTEADKNYAESLTRNLDRWLTELGIGHEVISDDKLGSGLLADTKVVILGYNPVSPKKELWALKTYAGKGGKFIVFYGVEPELAELMNVKLGKQLMTPKGGKWSSIRFNENAPKDLPDSVTQESRVIRSVSPVDGKSKVIAMWQDAEGKNTGESALLQSERGFWMSHVLLDDGDVENKKLMLLGLVAALDPTVWRPAAIRSFEIAGTVGKFRNFEDACAALTAQAKGTTREAQVTAALSQADSLYGELTQLLNSQKYVAVVERSRALRTLLVDAYAAAQQPRTGEFRAVWERTGAGLYPGDWSKTCRALKDNGFTDVLAYMAGSGLASYKSKAFEESEMFNIHGDQLAQCVAAAHAKGLKVHAWMICWKMDNAPEDMLKSMKKQGRLQMSDTGQQLDWLCPSQPANRQLELDGIKEMAGNYKVDGIHLDYIRFKDFHYCYCPTCKVSFEKYLGHSVEGWPEAVKEGELRKEFCRWRASQITGFVRDASVEAKKVNPDIKISAAVYGKFQCCADSVGQNWPSWLEKNYVDFICPMDYTNSLQQFDTYVKSQVNLPTAKGRIYPGIGVTATESRLDPIQVIDQIVAARKDGATGFVLFDLNRGLEKDYLPLFRQGLTAE
jgi:uncharacterized lipoprotein YddW (UPF0748 family)